MTVMRDCETDGIMVLSKLTDDRYTITLTLSEEDLGLLITDGMVRSIVMGWGLANLVRHLSECSGEYPHHNLMHLHPFKEYKQGEKDV